MLRSFELGPLGANCYVFSCDRTGKTLVVDPGGAEDDLTRYLRSNRLCVVSVVCTHGHYDHIGGIPALKKQFPQSTVCIHEQDVDMLVHPRNYVPFMGMLLQDMDRPDATLADGQQLTAGDEQFMVIHTPGHTRGCVCLYNAVRGIVFTGDTLFLDGVGRTDLTGGSTSSLVSSIREKLFVLPEATVVYPGHGPETSIGYEKANNAYVGEGAL